MVQANLHAENGNFILFLIFRATELDGKRKTSTIIVMARAGRSFYSALPKIISLEAILP
jgi:hypothetical protein